MAYIPVSNQVYIFVFLCTNLACINEGKEWTHRNVRYLPFPMGMGNKLQIIAGFGIPVALETESLTFGYLVKTNYGLPTNVTQFTTIVTNSEKIMRWSLYDIFNKLFEKMYLGGKDCLLRSICESAYTPLGHNGVLGEILHIILSPSSTTNEFTNDTEQYNNAEEIGRTSTSHEYCTMIFPNCSMSLLDMVSKVEDKFINEELIKYLNWI